MERHGQAEEPTEGKAANVENYRPNVAEARGGSDRTRFTTRGVLVLGGRLTLNPKHPKSPKTPEP